MSALPSSMRSPRAVGVEVGREDKEVVEVVEREGEEEGEIERLETVL